MVKSVSADGGLATLAEEYFDNIETDGDNSFAGSFGILTAVNANYNQKGQLVTDVVQMKGSDLQELLSSDDGREKAMESRRRWSEFLDSATGYSPKQRGDKAKESGKKTSKAKSAMSQARHFMKMSDVDSEKAEKAEALITEIQECLDRGDVTRAASRGEILGKLF
jgi:hypothetical protein